MSHRTCRYAIAYDISDDRERGKVDKLLKGWGHRAQKSVFMVMTTRYRLRQLQAELMLSQTLILTLVLIEDTSYHARVIARPLMTMPMDIVEAKVLERSLSNV